MTTMEIIMDITRKNVSIPLSIQAKVSYREANRCGHPDNWSPEESEVEIKEVVVLSTGRPLSSKLALTDEEIRQAEAKLIDALINQADDYEPDYDEESYYN